MSRLHLTLYMYLPLHVYTPHTQTLTPPPSQADRDIELMARWRHCALSGEALKLPVVACDLGRCVCLSVSVYLSVYPSHTSQTHLFIQYHPPLVNRSPLSFVPTFLSSFAPTPPLSFTNWVLITPRNTESGRCWEMEKVWLVKLTALHDHFHFSVPVASSIKTQRRVNTDTSLVPRPLHSKGGGAWERGYNDTRSD